MINQDRTFNHRKEIFKMNNQEHFELKPPVDENELTRVITFQNIAGDMLITAMENYIKLNPNHKHLFDEIRDKINHSQY